MSRVQLCPLDPDNIETYRCWRNDPEIKRWCRQYDLISKDDQKAWYQWQNDDPQTFMFQIIYYDEKFNFWAAAGVCGLTSYDHVNRRAEFSLYISPQEQKKGIGRKALMKLLDFGFDDLNLHLIWGESFDGNPAIPMFESLGFKKEGTRRDFYYKGGKYIDAHLFSMKRDERAYKDRSWLEDNI